MFHLIYLSSACTDMPETDLEEMLAVSRRNNSRAAITGMLLYLDGNFIQYLEGKRSAVRGLYEKIRADPRHRGIIVVEAGPTERRVFDDWSMGFRRVDRSTADAAGLFDLTRQSLAARVPDEFPRTIRIFMEQFYRANSPAA